MQRKYIYLLLSLTIVLFCCAHEQKIEYNIPAQYSQGRKDSLLVILEQGRILYKDHCSECHGIYTKGKDGIPNFTNQQMDGYNKKFLMRDAKNHAVATKMDFKQLNTVLLFLRYKKPADSTRQKRG